MTEIMRAYILSAERVTFEFKYFLQHTSKI